MLHSKGLCLGAWEVCFNSVILQWWSCS